MSEKRYAPEVKKELMHLARIAEERAEIKMLKNISTVVNRWKKGTLTPAGALTDIRRLTRAKEAAWSEDADPGVPVAHALAGGTLDRSDLSDQAWYSIDLLVTLAEM